MDLYKKAGAKYFVSIGVHHDNFDLWNSVHALKHGLRFGVSEHLSNGYNRLATSHRSDREGPYAGVPCDGADPRYADLYRDVPQCSRCVEAALVSSYSRTWRANTSRICSTRMAPFFLKNTDRM